MKRKNFIARREARRDAAQRRKKLRETRSDQEQIDVITSRVSDVNRLTECREYKRLQERLQK
jgi:hypothetical protein